jgi:hypothetical protein
MTAKNLNCTISGNFTYDFMKMEIDGEAYVNITDLIFDMEVNLTTQ